MANFLSESKTSHTSPTKLYFSMAIQTDDIFDRCSKGMILYFCYYVVSFSILLIIRLNIAFS